MGTNFCKMLKITYLRSQIIGSNLELIRAGKFRYLTCLKAKKNFDVRKLGTTGLFAAFPRTITSESIHNIGKELPGD